MKSDIAAHIGAVTRVVEDRERDGKPSKAVIATRTYDTDPDDLWDALTNAERIPRWFLPITGDLRLGGRYQFQGNAGGTIIRCEPPKVLAATWEFGGGVTWVTVTLTPEKNATRLELVHEAHPEEHWDKFGPGAVGVGWELGLMGLARHLATKAAVNEAESHAWTVSPEGKDFVRAASDGWGNAAIAQGADPTAAKASAERTRAFYTGEAS